MLAASAGLVASDACCAQLTAYQLSSGATDNSQVFAVSDGVFGGYSTSTLQPGVWANVSAGFTNLTPSGLPNGGEVRGFSGERQFGMFAGKAAMWSGSAATYINMHPTGAFNSRINAAHNGVQVGYATYISSPGLIATLWTGTAGSAVSLHPAFARESSLNAAYGAWQAGYVTIPQPSPQADVAHAGIWSGTASSFVDLNPPGVGTSGIFGMHGAQQVGVVESFETGSHAAIWFGTPQSFVDMHPFSDGQSVLRATCGSAQVGWVNATAQGAGVKAGIWFGSSSNFINLAQFLPPGAGESAANCVEERDGVFTVGGYARYGSQYRAFVWVGVPSPSSIAVMTGAGLWAGRRRRL